MTKQYVLGLAFWRGNISLIYKTKGPEYVINTWNGIGGKVEPQDEGWIEGAMSREYCEETGLFLSPDMWKLFATQRGTSWDGNDYELNCLVAHVPDDFDASKIANTEGDGEVVQWFAYTDHEIYESFLDIITPNLKWMIPLALDETTGFLEIREI